MRVADTMSWRRVRPSGCPPSPRSAHSATLVHDRFILVFGGWDGEQELGDLHALDAGPWPTLRHAERALC